MGTEIIFPRFQLSDDEKKDIGALKVYTDVLHEIMRVSAEPSEKGQHRDKKYIELDKINCK